jgi:hypothetical protein
MKPGVHHYPSVGSLIKKVIEINPDMSVKEITALIRKATRTPTNTGSEMISGEFVDEKMVLELAKATVQ